MEECCRRVRTGSSKELTAAVYGTTPTDILVESDCGSVGTPKVMLPLVMWLSMKESTEFAGRGTDTPAQDAVKFAGELVQRTTSMMKL
ncbi:hypothetical protein Plhal304r1_c043g0123171 [Plasmopara halstedii]